MGKKYTEDLYRRDKRKTESFEEESEDKEHEVLESEMKAALKGVEINKSPGVEVISRELFQTTDTESVKIPTGICQQIWETMAKNKRPRNTVTIQ